MSVSQINMNTVLFCATTAFSTANLCSKIHTNSWNKRLSLATEMYTHTHTHTHTHSHTHTSTHTHSHTHTQIHTLFVPLLPLEGLCNVQVKLPLKPHAWPPSKPQVRVLEQCRTSLWISSNDQNRIRVHISSKILSSKGDEQQKQPGKSTTTDQRNTATDQLNCV